MRRAESPDKRSDRSMMNDIFSALTHANRSFLAHKDPLIALAGAMLFLMSSFAKTITNFLHMPDIFVGC